MCAHLLSNDNIANRLREITGHLHDAKKTARAISAIREHVVTATPVVAPILPMARWCGCWRTRLRRLLQKGWGVERAGKIAPQKAASCSSAPLTALSAVPAAQPTLAAVAAESALSAAGSSGSPKHEWGYPATCEVGLTGHVFVSMIRSKSWQRCDEYDFLHCERQIPHSQVISRQKRLRAYHFIILLCPPQLQFPLSSHDILKETRKGSSFGARICRIRHSERHLAPPATSRNPRHAHPKNHHRATYIGHQKCERRHSTQKSMIRRTAFQRWRTNLDEK